MTFLNDLQHNQINIQEQECTHSRPHFSLVTSGKIFPLERWLVFFGIMLRIRMEPRKMGGYTSYFQDNPVIKLASGNPVQLRGYDPWAKEILFIIRFL